MLQINTNKNHLYGKGEISPPDDYSKPESSGKSEIFAGYLNDAPGRTETDKKNWADDTNKDAERSIRWHLLEGILKIPSYFLFQSDFSNTWIGKAIFTAEKMTGALGDRFRNQIYGHKDRNENRDDNVGAEEFTKSEADKDSWIPSLGLVNNQFQTKGRFLVSALGLISPDIANDLDWAFIQLFDSMWWRNMGTNIAFGPNFSHKLYKTAFSWLTRNKDKNQGNKITWDYAKNKFQEHKTEAAKWWGEFKRTNKSDSEKRKECLINASLNLDKTISSFTPIINWLNVFGDIARPIARRLDFQGLPRTMIRLLSVIDRPLVWANNIFRFYIPEKLICDDKDRNKLFPSVTLSDLLLTSTIADMFDFGFTIGENKLNESSGNLQHLIEIGRRLKDSAQDIYFAARRRKGLEELDKKTDSSKENPPTSSN